MARLKGAPYIMNIERDQKLAVTHAALGRNGGAGARRKPHVRRSRFTPLRDAVRLTGEDRSAKRGV